MQIFHQKTGHDHAHAVVHPTCGQHLAHAGIHNRITRLPGAPCRKTLLGAIVGVNGHRCHFRLQILPGGAWLMMQHIGIKLAPTKFAAIHIVISVGAQLGEQLARMQHTESQIRRQLAAAIPIGVVALLFITAQCVTGKMLPTIPRGRFASHRQFGCEFGVGRNAVALDVRRPTQVHRRWRWQWRWPTMSHPAARKRREHGIRFAVVFAHGAWVDGIRRADSNEFDFHGRQT